MTIDIDLDNPANANVAQATTSRGILGAHRGERIAGDAQPRAAAADDEEERAVGEGDEDEFDDDEEEDDAEDEDGDGEGEAENED